MPIQLSGSGSITGVSTLTSLASLDVTGSVSVGGTLIYDDVTNIDSIGIVTARSDVHVGAGLSVTGISTFSNDVKLLDDDKLKFGIGEDLEIYHDSSSNQSIIKESGANVLKLLGSDLRLSNTANTADYLQANDGGAVKLFFNGGTAKFETTATGVTVTGTVTASGTGGGAATLGSHLDLGDNQKVRLGASDDLDMYHDGTDSYIRNNTGQLLIRGNDIKLNNYLGTKTHAEFADGGLTTGAIDLSAISASISGTAVDVFVYDTRKDSDGGAWRKRTQHTSWYNETLNTSTRGSRREFPAVAVIVVTAATTRKLYIYDGDDPNLPMWMVIDTIDGQWPQVESSSLHALNGIIALGSSSDSQPLYETRNRLDLYYFVSDKIESSGGGTGGSFYGTVDGLVNRRSHAANLGSPLGNSVYPLVNMRVNDVAMTVLPNAPIDQATGLPVPTIAVGTDGGASIIKDDGSVVDITITTGSNYDVEHIDFTDDNRVVILWNAGGGEITIDDIPSADTSANYPINLPGSYYNDHSPASYSPCFLTEGPSLSNRIPVAIQNFRAVGTTAALSLFDENKTSEEDGMVAFISSSYNTGYQQGRIRGAFLADTDATSATDSNVVINGTFDSNTNSWSGDSGASVSWDSGGFASVGNGGGDNTYAIQQTGILVSGAKYRITGRVQPSMSGSYEFRVRAGGSGTQWNMTSGLTNGQWYSFDTGIITADGTKLEIGSLGGTITNFYLDDVYVWKLEEEDRSLNNTGLEVHGTITKQPVATGAELVAYSGWNDVVNNLYQPYNSDLDFGTGDFSIMTWANHPVDASGSAHSTYISHTQDNSNPPSNGDWIFRTEGSNGYLTFYIRSGGTWYSTQYATSVPTSTWYHTAAVRRGGIMHLYIDGKEVASGSLNYAANSTNGIRIGVRYGDTNNYSNEDMKGSMSLLRISASAPSPEQIKKIYEDERVLFQENVKCTLYGSSDAVTALGYDEDTELLHVGTSSGRSDFQGLRRINNTTTAVTTAISASDDLIAEQ